MDLITPTNGALLAMLLAADVPDVDEIVALLG
jgi:hypothetical protein